MNKNLLIIHGGGPTAVLNASLYGVLTEAGQSTKIDKIYGAKNGRGGLLREDFLDLTNRTQEELESLLTSPGTAIGTSRDALEETDYLKMVEILKAYQIKYILMNGGNGTMDTCGKLYQKCKEQRADIQIIGIPKTMDNDIRLTDHCPGYGSAARYLAQSVKEVCCDVKSLATRIVVIEASGRNAGWVTAASALADESGVYAPDLIYLPEVAFDEHQFLTDVKNKLKIKKGFVIVVSEGLRDKAGQPIAQTSGSTTGRSAHFGTVSLYLADLITEKIGYRARGEKPGLLGRASIALQSEVDLYEAILVGVEAVRAVIQGETAKMVAFRRVEGPTYQIETFLVPIEEVMLVENKMPAHFINETRNGVTPAFIEWCRPLIGSDLPEMVSWN